MKNIIVGTAGHIDHGKTTLIKALTGRNTDRLKEEQNRGISIELGFTYFDLPSGLRAGIIDVPGHEKFIKNMLAGVIGMDVVILVVAADEGMMPQSVEHLAIMNLLGIKNGFIVLTKTDKVDPEWLELVEEETKEDVVGTFLEGKPIIRVSSITGEGIDLVKEEIEKIALGIDDEKAGDLPRLPVDRSFTISGFGTVVTGTLLSGEIKTGDEVQVFPGNQVTRIRSIQVHDNDVEKAFKGQRVALNLAGVKKEDVHRGSMIAPKGSMMPSKLIDVEVKTIDLPYHISNRTRLRLYIGTQEVFCRIILLDKDEAGPNELSIAQLVLEEPIVARKGDRFILRLFSPMITIGGGIIIDSNPSRKKRFNEDDIKLIELMGSGDSKDVTEAVINEHSNEFPGIGEIAALRSKSLEDIDREVESLEEEGKVSVVKMTKETFVIHSDYLKILISNIEKDIERYHQKYPLRTGISKEEVRSKYLKNTNKKLGELFLNIIVDNSDIEDKNEFLKLEEFNIEYDSKQRDIKSRIENSYSDYLANPRMDEVFKNDKISKAEITEVLNSMISSGDFIRLEEDIILKVDDFNNAIQKIKNQLSVNEEISISEARDMLDTNRKIALAILEYMDKIGVTERTEEGRRLV
ncbi:MAG: selenocysteine-specific translation elongation factor [Tissierellia bacterium]|nr:selenocysteine-specific translation elongation factor [Tissierellia bacterium]